MLVSGNEILPPGSAFKEGCIIDSNTPMLSALLERDGAEVLGQHHLTDDADEIRGFFKTLDCDILIAAGGTSVGREDFLPVLLSELGSLPIHGVAMRPSAPTGIGMLAATKVFLLPGNPVSCLCAYDFFAGPALRWLGGHAGLPPYAATTRVLSKKISSQIGRFDYVRVAMTTGGEVSPIALSGASILSSTTQACGYVVVPEDSEGLPLGAEVQVFHFDGAGARD